MNADHLLIGAAVYTVDPHRPTAEAIAIAGGQIVAVGDDVDVLALRGPGTEILDVGGRTVLPGFQDAHCHPPMGGLDRLRCDVSACADGAEALAIIAAYATEHPDLPWIRGGGWLAAWYPDGPSAADLEAATGGRPAYLTEASNHGGWANTSALVAAGIDRTTPDPADGRIDRDAQGEPAGFLHETATGLVARAAPATTREETIEAILLAQREFLSLGITAWQDAAVGEPQWGDSLVPYHDLAVDGRLVIRTVGSLWWWPERGEEQVETFVGQRARSVGRFDAGTVKLMVDGIIETHTASMLEPYADGFGDTGMSYLTPEELRRIVTMLDAAGFQVHVHASGDRAIRDALDAFEGCRHTNGSNDNRHHIAHCSLIHPQDIPRFAELGVTATCQPLWGTYYDTGSTDDLAGHLGPERVDRQYRYGSIARAGGRLAFGSDWNVSTQDPLAGIETAVRRIVPDHRDVPPFYPQERIPLDTAIEAATMGSAFVNHLDATTGSLTPGKTADLVVLDRDLFAGGVAEIADARVALTLIDGEIVYGDGSLA